MSGDRNCRRCRGKLLWPSLCLYMAAWTQSPGGSSVLGRSLRSLIAAGCCGCLCSVSTTTCCWSWSSFVISAHQSYRSLVPAVRRSPSRSSSTTSRCVRRPGRWAQIPARRRCSSVKDRERLNRSCSTCELWSCLLRLWTSPKLHWLTEGWALPCWLAKVLSLLWAFSVTAARAWNSLPSTALSAPSLEIFRQRLKTELFSRSFMSPNSQTIHKRSV